MKKNVFLRLQVNIILAAIIGVGLAIWLWPGRQEMAIIEYKSQRYADVSRQLEDLSVSRQTQAEHAYIRSRLAERQGEVGRAAEIVGDFLKVRPRDAEARRQYWEYLRQARQFDTYLEDVGENYFDAATDEERGTALMLYDRFNYPEKEREFLEKIAERQGLTIVEFRRLLSLYLRLNEPEKALALLESDAMPGLSQWSADDVELVCDILIGAGRNQQAMKLATTYLASVKDSPAIEQQRQTLAQFFYNAGFVENAAALLKESGIFLAEASEDRLFLQARIDVATVGGDTAALDELAVRFRSNRLSQGRVREFIQLAMAQGRHFGTLASAGNEIAALAEDLQLFYFTALVREPVTTRMQAAEALAATPTISPVLVELVRGKLPDKPDRLTDAEKIIAGYAAASAGEMQLAQTFLNDVTERSYAAFTDSLITVLLQNQAYRKAEAMVRNSRVRDELSPDAAATYEAILNYQRNGTVPMFAQKDQLAPQYLPWYGYVLAIAEKRNDKATTARIADYLATLDNTDDPDTQQLLASAYMRTNQPEKALALIERILQNPRASGSWHYAYAETLQKLGRSEEVANYARARRNTYQRNSVEYQSWHSLLVTALSRSGNKQAAFAEWRDHAATANTVEETLQQAYFIEGLGYPEEAVKLLLKLQAPQVKADSPVVGYLFSLKTPALTSQRQQWLRKQAFAAPAAERQRWLVALNAQNQHRDVMEFARQFPEAAQQPQAALVVARSLDQLRNKADLRSWLQGMLARKPDTVITREVATIAGWHDLTDVQQAAYDRMLSLDPNDSRARAFLATQAGEARQYGEVVRLLKPLADNNDLSTDVLAQYAFALQQTGDMPAARVQYQRVLTAYRGKTTLTPAEMQTTASAFTLLGQPDKAISVYQHLLTLKPNDRGIRADLIHLLLDNNRVEEANALTQ